MSEPEGQNTAQAPTLQQTYRQLHAQLLRHITGWDRRFRLAMTPLWLPRGLIAGVAFGVLVALISRLRPWLFTEQVAIIAGLAAAVGAIMALVGVWAWPRPALQAAQYFD